jgi:hypothetical protein
MYLSGIQVDRWRIMLIGPWIPAYGGFQVDLRVHVTPAKAGVQIAALDSRLRGND